ncbi:hypothetical protein LH935_06750 [Gordonia polyisoprenivorans]|uniref:hypothetical protein n=1 Tax=Gordonia polyisoprenivorans TaxID=84595 RepID=UPI0022342D24|nr:hypothetical protein LH935_06750 [Gordonia polyisoprenivorans]
MSRFDQRDLATNPYGKCKDCGIEIATEAVSLAHMKESRHAIWVINPSREHNIERYVSFEIETALEEAFEDLYRLVESGEATADEIEKALASSCYIDNEWRRYVENAQ